MKLLSTLNVLILTLVSCTAILKYPTEYPKHIPPTYYIEQCEQLREGVYQGIADTGELVTIRHGRATFKRYKAIQKENK